VLYPDEAPFGAMKDTAPDAQAKQRAEVDRILDIVKKQNDY